MLADIRLPVVGPRQLGWFALFDDDLDWAAEARRRAAHTGGRCATGIIAREFQVAGLLADGLTKRQIRRRLAISEPAAEWYVENGCRKLGVGSRVQWQR